MTFFFYFAKGSHTKDKFGVRPNPNLWIKLSKAIRSNRIRDERFFFI